MWGTAPPKHNITTHADNDAAADADAAVKALQKSW
jgi:hypothetical protein